ncbi:hypothetical protein F2Q70_00030001 [Brassica cretica]|uniref:Uncharacterized protein n=1 Tax=Brassica cretica TaxID=69181 RepID=A0A8S9H537_BRACR|nr:hypothetical protein F2Q70_00030001 [Brassica cretica]KAF2553665.1 hypothetical protein F2Q68_00033605 [Brassica cretica]
MLRQMGQQVKWPPKMKAPDSFRNPGLWCDFHHDHGHKTEDCVALEIEVNELLQKGHLREFLSEKAKAHLSKEASGKSKGDAPSSPPRQDRVIHVISGGSEVSDVSHAAAKKSTRNAKHGLETAQPKRLLLGTDEISFTAKEQQKILAPHHSELFGEKNTSRQRVLQQYHLPDGVPRPRQLQSRHQIPGNQESGVNNRGNSGTLCIIQTLHPKIFQSAYVDRFAWSPLKTCKAAPAHKIWSPQDPRPPPHIDKIARSFNSYQPAISQINKWGTNTPTKPPRKRAPSRHQTESSQQAPDGDRRPPNTFAPVDECDYMLHGSAENLQ